MANPDAPASSPLKTLIALVGALVAGVVLLEVSAARMLEQTAHEGGVSALSASYANTVNAYLDFKDRAGVGLVLLPAVVAVGVAGLYFVGRRLAAFGHDLRERRSGMKLRTTSHETRDPFNGDVDAAWRAFYAELRKYDPKPETRPGHLLGFNEEGAPEYLTEASHTTHREVRGKTGAGKSKSVLFPLVFQDARFHWTDPHTRKHHRRSVVLLDAKGAVDVEEDFAGVAKSVGRLHHTFQFSLNLHRPGHSYNPLYMRPNDDPTQVGERFFSAALAPKLTQDYFREEALRLWGPLMRLAKATGKQAIIPDFVAAIQEPRVMAHFLSMAPSSPDTRFIQHKWSNLVDKNGSTRKLEEHYSGLLAALSAMSHPRLHTYDPDIVLEDVLANGYMVSFAIPVQAYKFQAKAIAQIVLEHLQFIGQSRQQDRSLGAAPIAIYADEFYEFAYDGFETMLSKMRDAGLSMTLLYQNYAQLKAVSPEFAEMVDENARTKIIMTQTDPEACDALSAGLGTRQEIELTVRRSTDQWLNQASALEASSRQVETRNISANRFKHLRTGQAILIQVGIAPPPVPQPKGLLGLLRRQPPPSPIRAVGVNLPLFRRPCGASPRPPKPLDTSSDKGLCLHNLFSGVPS